MAYSMEQRDIPEEVIFAHILPRLPVKILGKFFLVKKTWYAFIKSSSFIRNHLIQSFPCLENESTSGNLLHLLLNNKNLEECGQLFAEGPNGYNSISYIKGVNFLNEEPNLTVVGSCNGLLCITPDHPSKYGRKIYLWNPAIQKFRTVLDSAWNKFSSFIWIVLGCWYSFAENDFKLVRILDVFERSCVEVYSLSTGLWKKIEDVAAEWIILSKKEGVFVDCSVNWVAYSAGNNSTRLVVSFDTKTEVFKTFELPILASSSLLLMDYRGSLAVFAVPLQCVGWENSWSLWVQRKDDETSYWVKLCNVVTPERLYQSVGISINYDILLLINNLHVVAYDIRDKTLKDIEISRYLHGFSQCTRYRESLLLLDD